MTAAAVGTVVALHHVGVSFNGRAVLHDINVTLPAGTQHAVTGRSGSGKTSLLLVLAGLLAPQVGTVETNLATRDVVYVPQAPSLVGELTVAENASLGLRLRGIRPADAQARGIAELRRLGLEDADDALPSQLSGGMQQRVALARALAVQPRLLLADEPTGALDQVTGQRVLAAILEHAGEHAATLVIATHDLAVAAGCAHQLTLDGPA